MSWDQTTGREDVENFLLRELGISLDNLVAEAIKTGLAEKGLTIEVSEDAYCHEGAGLGEEFHPQVVKFSDGRTFVEALTEIDRGDDWGNDYYSFVEAGKSFEVTRNEYHYGKDPHTTKEEMISTHGLVLNTGDEDEGI